MDKLEGITFGDLEEYVEKYDSDYDFTAFEKDIISSATEIGNKLRNAPREVFTIVKELSDAVKQFAERLEKFPETEKYKNIFTWSNTGWGFIDELPIHQTYFKNVNSIKKADEIMSKCITDDIVDALIKKSSKFFIGNMAFEEAINCFNEQKYLSCILILYSLMDAMYIKWQELPLKPKEKRKLAGQSSEYLAKTELVIGKRKTQPFHYAMYLENLGAACTLFAGGDDFKEEPDLPNRNFISHGMNERFVTRLDCIKVLSVLNGIYEFQKETNIEQPVKLVLEKQQFTIKKI